MSQDELTTQAPKENLGVNKEYTEYKLDISSHYITGFNGEQRFDHHIMELGKEVRKTRIEPRRMHQLNLKCHTRRLYLVEAGTPKPLKVKRSFNTRDAYEKTGKEWNDELIFE